MLIIFKAESAPKRICLIVVLFILLLISLPPPIHATSWYANIGSWRIERQSETLSFELQDYYSGNITGIEATPQGRMVSGVHSRYIDIDLNDVAVKQRRSAFRGEIKSERYAKLSADAEEPITREVLKPSGTPFHEFNFTENWPVKFESDEAVVYRGTEINDRDLSRNNLDLVSSSFLHAVELSGTKHCHMEFSRLNITVTADNDDVVKVEFLPTKNLNYSIEAFSSGMTDLSYRQTAPDMVTIINEGDQSFFGDYALNATIEMGATNKKRNTDFQFMGCSGCPGACAWESGEDAS
jgi:hypothetical protein